VGRTIAVTGANGFIGRHFCAELAASGWDVRGVVRRAEAAGDVPPTAEPVVIQHTGNPEAWAKALEGATAVVHLIGRAHVMRDPEIDPLAAHRAVNVAITEAVLHACRSIGARQLVFMSSIAAVGTGSDKVYAEDVPCSPATPYGVTKLEAEQRIMRAMREGCLACTILRAPAVYGPEQKGHLSRLMELIRRGIPLPIGSIRNRQSLLFIDNLSSAVRALLEQPLPSRGLFHIADPGPPLSTPELVRKLARLMNRPARIVPFPVSLMRLGGRLLGRDDDVERLTRSLVLVGPGIGENGGVVLTDPWG
jgi:nucleoside-diphosphate-sugar epimerase